LEGAGIAPHPFANATFGIINDFIENSNIYQTAEADLQEQEEPEADGQGGTNPICPLGILPIFQRAENGEEEAEAGGVSGFRGPFFETRR
jgi:hypothetical protein